jgi:phage-related baseplate assembly protein
MSGFNAIDLSGLPAPDIVETLDYEAILAEMLADL